MLNHTHLRSGHFYFSTFGNNLKLPDPPLPVLLPSLHLLHPLFHSPILQPYSTSLFIFNSVSLPLALTLPLVRTYVAITLPPFVITGMFTLFPLAYSYFSAWRKWKSVWELRSDSLKVLINPLGVISCVAFSYQNWGSFLFMEHHCSEIDLEAYS